MPKKRRGTAQIVMKLRQVEVPQNQGKTVAATCEKAGLTKQSYHRYGNEKGGLNVEQARELGRLEMENRRLKKLVRKNIAEGHLQAPSGAGRLLMPRG